LSRGLSLGIGPGFVPSLPRDYAAAGFRIAKAWTHLESNRTEESVDLGAVWVPDMGGFRTTPDRALEAAGAPRIRSSRLI